MTTASAEYEARRMVDGIWFVARHRSQAEAESAVDQSVRQYQSGRPAIGWLARPKGTTGPGLAIEYIHHGQDVVRLRGEDQTRPWAECEFALRGGE